MAEYQYQPLGSPMDIRIMQLDPGKGMEVISCTLKTISLHSNIEYEALSYVWGDISDRKMILCSSVEVSIGKNLHSALVTLRYPDRSRNIWADALCINQEDIGERDEQVKLMGEVYSRAKETIVWLGESLGVEEMKLALQLLNDLAATRVPEECSPTSLQKITERFLNVPLHQWNALAGILRREWFERVWIIQEAAKARSVIVHVGSSLISWKTLSLAVDALLRCNLTGALQAMGLLSGPGTVGFIETIKLQPTRMDHILLELLINTRRFKATDCKDKLMGILGLISKDDIRGLDVSYSMSITQVYTNIALYFLFQVKSLRFLSCTAVPPTTCMTQVPSWVPNWEYSDMPPFSNGKHYYKASKDTKADVSVSRDSSFMTARGQIVDKISEISDPYELDAPESASFGSNMEYWTDMKRKKGSWTAKCIAMVTNNLQSSSYIQSEKIEAFLRAFICNLSLHGTEPHSSFLQDVKNFLLFSQANASYPSAEVDMMAQSFSEDQLSELSSIEQMVDSRLGRKCFCITSAGRYAWVPKSTQIGDEILLLHGADIPFVARPTRFGIIDEGDEEIQYQLHGESYVHSIMKGEALQLQRAQLITFC